MLLRNTPPPAETKPQLPPPLYSGSVRLHDWKNSARGGMSVDLGVREAVEVHPFKGLSAGKEHGQRMKVWIGSDTQPTDDNPAPANEAHYLGDAILMFWGDTSTTGMVIRILIDSGPDGTGGKHPFEGFATGRKEGELLQFVAWAVADDETFQHPEHMRRKTPFYELTAVRQANILCRDQTFINYLVRVENYLVPTPVATRPEIDLSNFAAELVRAHLGIDSRSVLNKETDEGNRARRRWELLMKMYFESFEYRTR